MPQLKWDNRFLDMAHLISTWSKDPSTKCGAVITRGKQIISLGFNGFPAACSDKPIFYDNRELKYERVLHAEINAILFAGPSLGGCTIYTYPFPPCARCAATIIQAGITRVISPKASPDLAERWEPSLNAASDMYQEAGVTFMIIEDGNYVSHRNGMEI